MLSLLIDTHSEYIIYALYKDEKLLKKSIINEKKDHSSICMTELIKFLEKQKIEAHEISDIVVVNGPGSFTGVRIGVTIAKTLAYSLNIPIRTITSLELLIHHFPKNTEIAIEEKNGYFVGSWNRKAKKVENYRYLNKKEYDEYKKEKIIEEPMEVSFDNLISYAHEKSTTNAHAVKPFYVKKIEVEK